MSIEGPLCCKTRFESQSPILEFSLRVSWVGRWIFFFQVRPFGNVGTNFVTKIRYLHSPGGMSDMRTKKHVITNRIRSVAFSLILRKPEHPVGPTFFQIKKTEEEFRGCLSLRIGKRKGRILCVFSSCVFVYKGYPCTAGLCQDLYDGPCGGAALSFD